MERDAQQCHHHHSSCASQTVPQPVRLFVLMMFQLEYSQAHHRQKQEFGEDAEIMMGFIWCFPLTFQNQLTFILQPIAQGWQDAQSYLSKRNIVKSTKWSWGNSPIFSWQSQPHCCTGKVSLWRPVKTGLESEEHPSKTFCKSCFTESNVPKYLKKAIPWATLVLLIFKLKTSVRTQ